MSAWQESRAPVSTQDRLVFGPTYKYSFTPRKDALEDGPDRIVMATSKFPDPGATAGSGNPAHIVSNHCMSVPVLKQVDPGEENDDRANNIAATIVQKCISGACTHEGVQAFNGNLSLLTLSICEANEQSWLHSCAAGHVYVCTCMHVCLRTHAC